MQQHDHDAPRLCSSCSPVLHEASEALQLLARTPLTPLEQSLALYCEDWGAQVFEPTQAEASA